METTSRKEVVIVTKDQYKLALAYRFWVILCQICKPLYISALCKSMKILVLPTQCLITTHLISGPGDRQIAEIRTSELRGIRLLAKWGRWKKYSPLRKNKSTDVNHQLLRSANFCLEYCVNTQKIIYKEI